MVRQLLEVRDGREYVRLPFPSIGKKLLTAPALLFARPTGARDRRFFDVADHVAFNTIFVGIDLCLGEGTKYDTIAFPRKLIRYQGLHPA